MRGSMMWVVAFGCSGGETAPKADADHPAEPVVAPPEPAPAPAPPVMPVQAVPAGAKVMFVEPKDGAKVTSPVKLVFGVEGMAVKEAGDLTPDSGHHHLIVGPAGTPTGEIVPKDDTHIHFGKGQTEAELPLAPGEYQLTMQFADGNHTSFGPPMSKTITITVE